MLDARSPLCVTLVRARAGFGPLTLAVSCGRRCTDGPHRLAGGHPRCV